MVHCAAYVADVTRLATMSAETTRTLVICQPAGWRILEEAARHLAAAAPDGTFIRVAGSPAKGNGVVGSLRKRMPLLRSYGLVVATIAPVTGAISLGMRPLFQPGDAQGAESVLTLRRARGDRDATTLAVAVTGKTPLADNVAIDPDALDVLSMYEMQPADQQVYRVRAVLEAPGQVRFTEPVGITPLSRSWSETAAAIPRRVDMLVGPVNLVCALELAGDKAQVDRRRNLIRDLLEHLDDEFTDPGQLRVGLLGCTDHVFAPGEERRPVVRRQALGPATDALLALANFRGPAFGTWMRRHWKTCCTRRTACWRKAWPRGARPGCSWSSAGVWHPQSWGRTWYSRARWAATGVGYSMASPQPGCRSSR